MERPSQAQVDSALECADNFGSDDMHVLAREVRALTTANAELRTALARVVAVIGSEVDRAHEALRRA